jgi:hypothetical protein
MWDLGAWPSRDSANVGADRFWGQVGFAAVAVVAAAMGSEGIPGKVTTLLTMETTARS